MLPHVRIHRRRQQHLAVGSDEHGAGEIVGVPARELGHEIGGRGRDHDEIGLARQPDVADVEFAFPIEQVREHALARQRAGRQRRDEFLRRLGENAAHGEAAFFEPADEIERLVGGDAAADDEENVLRAGGRPRRRIRRDAAARRAALGRLGARFELADHQRSVAQGQRAQSQRHWCAGRIARRDAHLEEGIRRLRVPGNSERAQPRRRASEKLLVADVLIREFQRLDQVILVRAAIDPEQTDAGCNRRL